jgi:hypothetical protein
VDPETGYVLDLKLLKDAVEGAVIRDVDHRNLNVEVPWLEGVNPTTENFVVAVWNRLGIEGSRRRRLQRIVLWETPRNYVEYSPETTAREGPEDDANRIGDPGPPHSFPRRLRRRGVRGPEPRFPFRTWSGR